VDTHVSHGRTLRNEIGSLTTMPMVYGAICLFAWGFMNHFSYMSTATMGLYFVVFCLQEVGRDLWHVGEHFAPASRMIVLQATGVLAAILLATGVVAFAGTMLWNTYVAKYWLFDFWVVWVLLSMFFSLWVSTRFVPMPPRRQSTYR
jgi:hypothetical protein